MTLGRVLGKVKVEELEEIVSRYQRELDGECGEAGSIVTQQGEQLVGQALDGKTVRGASAHGELVHLVGLVRHGCGLVYDQVKASVKLHERRAADIIFARNDLRHTVTTTDALHTCKKQAQQILAGRWRLPVRRQGQSAHALRRHQRRLHGAAAAWLVGAGVLAV